MIQERSDAYLRQLCFRPAVLTLQAILYHPKLHYSEKILAAALLLEPRFIFPKDFKTGRLKRGLATKLAEKLGVSLSSITLWLKRISEVADFKPKIFLQQGGADIPYIVIK